jgi:hypothetical protein
MPAMALGGGTQLATGWSGSTSWAYGIGEHQGYTGTIYPKVYGLVTAGMWAEFRNIFCRNISVASITCKGSLGNLGQATPASMPWLSDVDAPKSVLVNGKNVLYFDGAAGHAVSSGAASTHPYHKAAGFTFTTAYYIDAAAAGTDTLLDTCNAAAANVGITIEYDATNTQIVVKVANGSGGFEVEKATGAASVAKGAWHVVTISWSQAGGVRILVNAAAAVTAASGGAASAADATATLQVGRTSGGANFLHGALGSPLIRVGAVSDTDLAKLHAYMRAYYAI